MNIAENATTNLLATVTVFVPGFIGVIIPDSGPWKKCLDEADPVTYYRLSPPIAHFRTPRNLTIRLFIGISDPFLAGKEIANSFRYDLRRAASRLPHPV